MAFLLLGEGCAQNVRKALSAGLVLRTTFQAPGPACGHTRHNVFTELQVAAGAGASLLAGISRPVPDL